MGYFVSGIITAIIGFCGNRKRRLTEHCEPDTTGNRTNPVRPGTCCGRHEVCERDSLLAATNKKMEYYDDEELDVYRGKESNRYDEREAEEFREVLYTMYETEVAGWLRCLQLRGINLPDQLKDEVLLIVEEKQQNN